MQLPVIAIYAVTVAAFLAAFLVFAHVTVKMQEELLYQEKIQAGQIVLGHFVNNAAMPLAEDDALNLNILMKEAKAIEGARYAAVVSPEGVVKAHTDIGRIGSVFEAFKTNDRRAEKDGTVMAAFQAPDGTEILDLSRPVYFMQNHLGAVHIGLSLTFIRAELKKEISGLVRDMALLGLVLLGLLLCSALALLFWLRKSRLYGPSALSGRSTDDVRLYWSDEAGAALSHAAADGANASAPAGNSSQAVMTEMNQNHVTVLFAGIKGFMAYAEINDHQKLMDDLNDYLLLATDCVQKYDGHIDMFVGDSVIAVFSNAPHSANHAERGLYAAVAMQKALKDRGKNGNPLLLKVGIGINSGVVLSGRIGTPSQKEQVFIGESIKAAYSLNFMAGPGEIVMTREAYRMVQHLVTVEPMPPRVLMQRTQSWENFRLLKVNKREG